LTALPGSNSKIHLLVVDSAFTKCYSLANALQKTGRYETVPCTDPREAFEFVQHARFDVGLIAIQSDGEMDAGFIRRIHRLCPALPIVVFLESRDRALIVNTLAAGAQGILCRADSFETLCECIRCVRDGQVWASALELGYVLDALFENAPTAPFPGARHLSGREDEIARLVAAGNSNAQISAALGLSHHTVKNYLFRIFEKLGLSSRVELTLYVLKNAAGGATEIKREAALHQAILVRGGPSELGTEIRALSLRRN